MYDESGRCISYSLYDVTLDAETDAVLTSTHRYSAYYSYDEEGGPHSVEYGFGDFGADGVQYRHSYVYQYHPEEQSNQYSSLPLAYWHYFSTADGLLLDTPLSAIVYGYTESGRPGSEQLLLGGTVYTRSYGYFTYEDENQEEYVGSRVVTLQERIGTNETQNLLTTWHYTYGENGNITGVSEQRGYSTAVNPIYAYTYDRYGRLTQAVDHEADVTRSYTYDGAGNILSYREVSNGTGALLKSYTYTYGDADWGDRLTAFNGSAIGYDANGNPLTWNGKTLTWDSDTGDLASASVSGKTYSKSKFCKNAQGIGSERR